jgi:hypothetical protein
VLALWNSGDEIRGWARYWAQLCGYIADGSQRGAGKCAPLMSFETLCAEPAQELTTLFEHCDLRSEPVYIETSARRIKAPGYYQPDFTPPEMDAIAVETAATVERFTVERLKLNRDC